MKYRFNFWKNKKNWIKFLKKENFSNNIFLLYEILELWILSLKLKKSIRFLKKKHFPGQSFSLYQT